MDYHERFRKGRYPGGRWIKTPGRKQVKYYEVDGDDISYAPGYKGSFQIVGTTSMAYDIEEVERPLLYPTDLPWDTRIGDWIIAVGPGIDDPRLTHDFGTIGKYGIATDLSNITFTVEEEYEDLIMATIISVRTVGYGDPVATGHGGNDGGAGYPSEGYGPGILVVRDIGTYPGDGDNEFGDWHIMDSYYAVSENGIMSLSLGGPPDSTVPLSISGGSARRDWAALFWESTNGGLGPIESTSYIPFSIKDDNSGYAYMIYQLVEIE